MPSEFSGLSLTSAIAKPSHLRKIRLQGTMPWGWSGDVGGVGGVRDGRTDHRLDHCWLTTTEGKSEPGFQGRAPARHLQLPRAGLHIGNSFDDENIQGNKV